MNVISINIFYKKGSTGKIVCEIHRALIQHGHLSNVFHGLENHNELNVYKYSSDFLSKFYTVLSALTGLQYSFSYYETTNLLNNVKQMNPDVVHIHVINCNTLNIYRLLQFLKDNNYKTVITFHAEFLYTGGCSHALECEKWKTGCGNCPRLWSGVHSLFFDFTNYFWRKFERIYSGFENNLKIICVSEWLKSRAMQSPFFREFEISVIENGIDTQNTFKPRVNNVLFERYKSEGKKIILHVTPSFKSKIKGGDYVIELAKRLDRHKYTIIIVGYDDNVDLPDNIATVGNISDQVLLAEYYSLADLTLLTSRVETYSMVCVESLSCGTPVVGFKCGAPEQIALKDFSCFVEYGDIDALEKAVYFWESKKIQLKDSLVEIAKDHYSIEMMVNKYINTYKKLI